MDNPLNEPLYRTTVEPANIGRDGDKRPLVLQEAIDIGALVPVEPCEHGNYARHLVSDDPYLSPTGPWCPGAGIGGDDDE